MGSIFLFSTMYPQMVKGLSPPAAGLWLIPQGIVTIISSILAPRLAQLLRPVVAISVGMVISAAGLAMMSYLESGSDLMVIVMATIVVCLGIGPASLWGPAWCWRQRRQKKLGQHRRCRKSVVNLVSPWAWPS